MAAQQSAGSGAEKNPQPVFIADGIATAATLPQIGAVADGKSQHFKQQVRGQADGAEWYFERIVRSGERLLSLLNNLLDLAKLEDGSQPIACEHFDIRPVVDDSVQEFAALMEHKQIAQPVKRANALLVVASERLLAGLLLVLHAASANQFLAVLVSELVLEHAAAPLAADA